MPRLTSPDGASVIVSRQAKDTLLARGYTDPNAPKPKQPRKKSTKAEPETEGDAA